MAERLNPKVADVKFKHPEDHVAENEKDEPKDILRPEEPPGEVPDIGGEFTTSGVATEHWTEERTAEDKGNW